MFSVQKLQVKQKEIYFRNYTRFDSIFVDAQKRASNAHFLKAKRKKVKEIEIKCFGSINTSDLQKKEKKK